MDSPGEADTYETTLRDGDIVVAYVRILSFVSPSFVHWQTQTDGLGDNVFPDEIATITSLVGRAGLPEDVQVQAMADRMANYARLCMLNKGRRSPFESTCLLLFLIVVCSFQCRRSRQARDVLPGRSKFLLTAKRLHLLMECPNPET